MPRGCKWIDKGHFCKHTHRAMYKNIFKGTWHFVSVDRFETHAELVYKDIVTNKMVLSIFRHHTCFYRSRRLLSIFSKGITSALTWHCQRPNYAHQSLALTSALCRVDNEGTMWPVVQHIQRLVGSTDSATPTDSVLCYKHPVFSTDFMCLPHTLISYLGTALGTLISLRALCKPLLCPSTASKDMLMVLASSKRLFNSHGGHNFAKADTHI